MSTVLPLDNSRTCFFGCAIVLLCLSRLLRTRERAVMNRD